MKSLIMCLTVSWALLICGCTVETKPADGVTSIDLTGDLNRQKELFLSDIALDLEYLRLDTVKEAMVGEVGDWVVTRHSILIEDQSSNHVFLFDTQGHFISQVGQPGKGPGEYGLIHDIAMDPDNGIILIMHGKQINRYGPTGKFIGSTQLPYLASRIEPFHSDYLLLFNSIHSPGFDNYMIGIFSQDGRLLDRLHRRTWQPIKEGGSHQATRLYRKGTLIYYNQLDFDTVYAVTPERKVVPKIAFIDNRTSEDPYFSPVFRYDRWWELPDYVIIGGGKDRRRWDLVYDRATQEIWHIPTDTANNSAGFINDLDGGFTLESGKIFEDKIFVLQDAYQFRSDLDLNNTAFVRPFDPEKRGKLRKFVAGLNDYDNLVLTVITLK